MDNIPHLLDKKIDLLLNHSGLSIVICEKWLIWMSTLYSLYVSLFFLKKGNKWNFTNINLQQENNNL